MVSTGLDSLSKKWKAFTHGATTPNLRNVRLKPLEPLGGTTSASTPPLRPLRPTPLGSGDTSSGAGEGWLRKPLPSLKK